MKKKLIIFLIITFLTYTLSPLKFVSAQFFSFDKVPVIEPGLRKKITNLADLIGSIEALLAEEFPKLNLQISQIIQNQIQEKVNDIFVDSLKETTFKEYLLELEQEIEKRKIKNPEELEKELEEARLAGAVETLKALPTKISCLNPRLRSEITDFTLSLTTDLQLNYLATEILDSIPDCEAETLTETTFSLKEPFLARLLKPFGLLAQMQPTETEVPLPPEIIISPAFQETEDAVEASELKNLISSSLLLKMEEKEKERKVTLVDNIKPIEECLRFEALDDGKIICLEKRTLIDIHNLKKLKETNIANPLLTTIEDENIFFKYSTTTDVLERIGLATSSFSASSLTGNEERLKEIIDKTCADYAINNDNTTDSNVLTYAKCLEIFKDKIENLAKIEKEKIESLKKSTEETKQRLDGLRKKIDEELKPDSVQCLGIYQDLEEISRELGGRINTYSDFENKLLSLSAEIDKILNDIQRWSYQLDDINSQLLNTPLTIINALDELLDTFNGILDIFGFESPIDLESTFLKKFTNKLENIKEIANDMLQKVSRLVNSINQALNKGVNILLKFNKFYFAVSQFNITRSTILDDVYEAREIAKKLEAYARLIKRLKERGCLFSVKNSSGENFSARIQEKIIVGESEIKKSRFSWFKNLFGSRLVEIDLRR